ncbi:MAG: DUF268 domain-containing protein [Leptospiraceae bacterium]|nr:DUF268 domain-containing protein [Leptospiraceae bacterium]MDW7975224.1 DUF268 domain-containing protein [Leptospiraceae bacterium]
MNVYKNISYRESLRFLGRGIYRFFRFQPFTFLKRVRIYLQDLQTFLKLHPSEEKIILYPELNEKLDYTPVDPVFFYQDTWFAYHIFRIKPSHHYDVGSSLMTMGIISQNIPVTFIDIRPPRGVSLPNFYFLKGSIVNLPFPDEYVETISSLCVIEHVGLGRYGDDLDPQGSEKAIQELIRVIKKKGYLFLSTLVGRENRIYFNAFRTFARAYLLELFQNTEIIEEKYIYDFYLLDEYDPQKEGVGLYLLRKK